MLPLLPFSRCGAINKLLRLLTTLMGVLMGMAGLMASPSASAATLTDNGVMTALQAGQAQRVIIQYKDTSTQSAEDAHQRRNRRHALKAAVLGLLDASHFKAQRDFSELPMSSMTLLKPGALAQLMSNPQVEAVFPDKRLKPHLAEALPLIGQPAVASVMGRKGAGVGMAILDTGVDYTKAEFGSCTAPGVPAATCRVAAAVEIATNDNALDSIGHGTEVAMTALAVAPDAKILALDVFDGGTAYTSDIVAGINWAISNKTTYNIGVINMSLGDGIEHTSACDANDPFYTPIRNARLTNGIVVVVSAGNEGYGSGISSPACVGAAMAVGAVYDGNVGTLGWNLNKYNSSTGTVSTVTCWDNATSADLVTCFTDSSSLLDVWAPGAMITVGGKAVAGTSISAPFVTGAVAVLKAQFASETASQIEARITSTGKAITDARNGIVKPRLDLLAAQGAPGNDNLASATALSGSAGSVSSWNYNATAQASEPAHAGQTASHSVWWTWTAPASGTLTLSTQGSSIDTVLAVYSGTSVNALTLLASNDNSSTSSQSQLSMAVTSGQTYKIAVDGKGGATGAVSLAWSSSNTAAVNLSVGLSYASLAAVGSVWTLNTTVANAGPQSASNAKLVLSIPAGLTLANAPAGCTASASSITCVLGNLASSASVGLRFDFNAVSVSLLQLPVSVSSDVPDSAQANNTATASMEVQPAGSANGGSNDSGDVPLPGWALGSLAAALWQLQRRHRSTSAGR